MVNDHFVQLRWHRRGRQPCGCPAQKPRLEFEDNQRAQSSCLSSIDNQWHSLSSLPPALSPIHSDQIEYRHAGDSRNFPSLSL